MQVDFLDADVAREALLAVRERVSRTWHESQHSPDPVLRQIAANQYVRAAAARDALQHALNEYF